MLANIDSELSTIQNGRYGEDIRTAIKDAISKVNNAGYMPVVENLNVVENGTYTPSAGVNGFSKVVVNVPGGGGGYPEPTGTISITENGTVNVKDYASANVNVQPNLQSKTATQNGTVTADSGYDGLSSVDVNVSGSGMLSGTTEPEVSLGADGDVYLQYIDMSIPPGVTIPTDCEILTYIEATGTQWVMTDYIPVSNTRLVMDCMLLGAANYYTLFGERRNTSSEGFYILCNGGNWKFMGNSGETGFSNALPLIERITIEAAYGEATWTNGSDSGQCTPTAGTTANTLPLFLFTLNSNGSDFGTSTHAKMRLYGLSIYEGDTLVRRYVPLLDSNGTVCLYETETDTLIYNAGNGTFISGGAPGEITNAYAKVNSAWRALVGSDIDDVDTSGSINLQSKTATENGMVTPDAGYDGLSSVDVNVQPNLQSKTATENGMVTADSGYDGLASVDVNVPGSISYGATDPVSSVGSDGDVYFKYGHLDAYTSLLPDNARDLDEWQKNAAAFTKFNNSYVDYENTLIQIGGNGYERIFVPVSVDSNTDYVFAMKYYSPSGVASGYGGQLCFGVSFVSESSMRSINSVTLDYYSNLSLTAETDYSDYSVSFNSGSNTSAYLVINLNITDGRECTLKIKDIVFYKVGEPPVHIDNDVIVGAYLKQNGAWVNAIGAIIE